MEALVTKASSQVEKVKAAQDQVMEEAEFMVEACEKRQQEIQGFFREVRQIFVIRSKDREGANSILN